jgi:S-(hydroxymethyl)glutathione dehydrogenase/alcohol dehydrogenase
MVGSGVCRSDLHVVDGDWERPAGVVLGHEGAAIVEELGPGLRERPADVPAGTLDCGAAAGHRVGDLVVLSWVAPCGSCPACGRGEAWLCATPLGGGHRLAPDLVRLRRDDGSSMGVYSGIGTFSTGQVVAAAAAVPVDPRTPPEVAALIGCAASTGVGAVRNTGVRAGEAVVIVGLGGVGLSALMAAVDAGATPVVAVDLEPAKRALALSLGATHVFGPAEAGAGVGVLASLGADHVLECIGLTDTVELAVDLVRPGGTVTLVGMTPQADRAGLDVYRVVHEGKRVLGSCYGSIVPGRDFPAIAADAVSGRLPLDRLVSETIDLADVGRALEAMRHRDGARRVVRY